MTYLVFEIDFQLAFCISIYFYIYFYILLIRTLVKKYSIFSHFIVVSNVKFSVSLSKTIKGLR